MLFWCWRRARAKDRMRRAEGTEGSVHTTNVVAFLGGLLMEMGCQGEHARKGEAGSGVSNGIFGRREPNRRKGKIEEAREKDELTKRLTSDLRQKESSLSSIVALLESMKREVEDLKKNQAEVSFIDIEAHRKLIFPQHLNLF